MRWQLPQARYPDICPDLYWRTRDWQCRYDLRLYVSPSSSSFIIIILIHPYPFRLRYRPCPILWGWQHRLSLSPQESLCELEGAIINTSWSRAERNTESDLNLEHMKHMKDLIWGVPSGNHSCGQVLWKQQFVVVMRVRVPPPMPLPTKDSIMGVV